jgi:hypothetical protein
MVVILATWEVEIKRIEMEASLSKKFTRPHFKQWLGTVACACHSSHVGKHK